jgi:hypothetical protein
VIQRNVSLALVARIPVPVGLTVANEVERQTGL